MLYQGLECIACSGAGFEGRGEELVECRACGLVVAERIPTSEDLKKLYREEYFFGKEYSDYKADRPALERNFRMRIEHLGQPERHIEKVSQSLKTGGALCLTTGNIGAWVARRRGDEWRMIHPPTHIYYFDVNSMTQLLSRYGLEVTSIRHRPTHRNVGSVLNQLIVNRKAQSRGHRFLSASYGLARLFRLDRVNFPLNLYDIMEVTAVKR